MEKYDDLVSLAKANDPDAFSKLYELIYQDLYRFALYTLKNVQDAQDAVSETVMDAYRGLSGLRENGAFKGWIFKILSAKCKRKLKQYTQNTVPLEEYMNSDEPNWGEQHDVREAFFTLSGEERLIISMSIFAGYTSQEIGKILHKNPNTIRSKQKRGLEKMRSALSSEQ